MAHPKQFDINKNEDFFESLTDKAQTLRYWNAAVEQGETVKAIEENLASNNDDKQIPELLLRQTDAINRREWLIKAVKNAIKFKYQPQIPEMFSAVNKAKQRRFVKLQQQNSRIGKVKNLMSALQDEKQIQNYLDNEEKEHAVDETMRSNEKLRNGKLANGEEVDEEENAAASQELLRNRSNIKAIIDSLLKSGVDGAILRSL